VRPGARFVGAGAAERTSADVIETFRTIAELKASGAPEAIRHYVISGARAPRMC
jgi:phosphoenolpyruvate carboxylase